MNKIEFKKWLVKNYPHLKPITITTTISDAFYIFSHKLGITFEEILHGEKSLEDYKNAIANYLVQKGSPVGSRPSGYACHLKYLIEFASESEGTTIHIPSKKATDAYKKPNKHIPAPSPQIIDSYLKKWSSLESYYLQERALNKLFLETYKFNKEIEDVLIKISALNDFYSTHIFNAFAVARYYVSINIDERLNLRDMSLVEDLCCVPSLKKRIYSFATKYCSHHKPDDYPIYDAYVDKMLNHFKNEYSFAEFSPSDLKNYPKFKEIILDFKSFFRVTKYSIKDIDKYLWQAGKEYFPKQY